MYWIFIGLTLIMKLHWKILIAMLLGVSTGLLFDSLKVKNALFFDLIILIGDIFIKLLKMVIVPLVFTSITIGVSSQ